MDILFVQFSQLIDLHLMQSTALDNQFEAIELLEKANATPEEKFLTESAIYNLADSRNATMLKIELKRKEIIIAFHKTYEVCLTDFKLEKKIEYFTGR